jgi:hypothetical protein
MSYFTGRDTSVYHASFDCALGGPHGPLFPYAIPEDTFGLADADSHHSSPAMRSVPSWPEPRVKGSTDARTVDLAYLSIAEAGALFRRRELSPVELINALLDRSERLQETLVPYVTLTPELARQQARTAESSLLQGASTSPLLGIPIAYKDIVMTKSIRTTCGSALHEDWRPTVDAAVVEKCEAADAVMMGKLGTLSLPAAQPPGHLSPAQSLEPRMPRGLQRWRRAAWPLPGVGGHWPDTGVQSYRLLRHQSQAHLRPGQPLWHHHPIGR